MMLWCEFFDFIDYVFLLLIGQKIIENLAVAIRQK
jgi:hypothetical protein